MILDLPIVQAEELRDRFFLQLPPRNSKNHLLKLLFPGSDLESV